jgi:hypothetical protein
MQFFAKSSLNVITDGITPIFHAGTKLSANLVDLNRVTKIWRLCHWWVRRHKNPIAVESALIMSGEDSGSPLSVAQLPLYLFENYHADYTEQRRHVPFSAQEV